MATRPAHNTRQHSFLSPRCHHLLQRASQPAGTRRATPECEFFARHRLSHGPAPSAAHARGLTRHMRHAPWRRHRQPSGSAARRPLTPLPGGPEGNVTSRTSCAACSRSRPRVSPPQPPRPAEFSAPYAASLLSCSYASAPRQQQRAPYLPSARPVVCGSISHATEPRRRARMTGIPAPMALCALTRDHGHRRSRPALRATFSPPKLDAMVLLCTNCVHGCEKIILDGGGTRARGRRQQQQQ